MKTKLRRNDIIIKYRICFIRNTFNILHRILLFCIIINGLTACVSTVRFASEPIISESEKSTNDYENPTRLKEKSIIGLASYYSDKFDGLATASGEIYNKEDFTAAHRTFPFGTIVLVTNLSNNLSVMVRINDRGPHKEDRIIDLSRAAAEKIDMIRAGVVEVKITVLE